MELSYYEREFIRQGAAELRRKEFERSMKAIKTYFGEDAYKEELLSEKPIRGGIIVRDPRHEIFLPPPKTWVS